MKGTTKLDFSLLLIRLILGTTVAAHGAQKLLGWFGGFGFHGTIDFFTQVIGLPYTLALGVVLTESVGMIALALGLATRFFSLSLVVIMIGAVATTHIQYGFFMNWFGAQAGEGFEFHLLIVTLSVVLVTHGAGAISLDRLISKSGAAKLESLFSLEKVK